MWIKRKTPLRKRGKKSPLKTAKETLWKLCREITRLVYGNKCYTCGRSSLEGSNWQTGHFITDATCSTELSYSLDNLRPQCYHCNINLSGNWIKFEEKMILDNGEQWVKDLKQRNEDTKHKKYDILWYDQKNIEYKKIYEQLQKKKDKECKKEGRKIRKMD